MTTPTTPAEQVEAGSGVQSAREDAAIVGTALGGVVAVVAWLALLYAFERPIPEGSGTHLAPWPYWTQFVLIPLVAFVGARFAPGRVRAVVFAACAAQFGTVVVFRGATLFRLDRFTVDLLITEAVLVGLAVVAAHLGAHRARRT